VPLARPLVVFGDGEGSNCLVLRSARGTANLECLLTSANRSTVCTNHCRNRATDHAMSTNFLVVSDLALRVQCMCSRTELKQQDHHKFPCSKYQRFEDFEVGRREVEVLK